ncbi:MAG: AsmA-like C-terminal region-containing protein [Salibacteraceae bacterium]
MKVIKILGSIILVLILSIIVLPIVFKGEIAEQVQKTMDENLNAKVTIDDFGLSLISSFPDFSLDIKGVSVIGKGEFENISLAKIGLIETQLDLMSVVSGDQIKVKKIGISDAYFHVIVNQDSLANYDIAVASTDTSVVEEEIVTDSEEEEGTFSLGINEYYLKNINVIYDDQPGAMYAEIVNLNHNGKGDMTLDVYNFQTQTNIEELTFKMEKLKYLNKANLDVKLNIGVDMLNNKYTFNENHFGINDLMLHFDGYVALPDEETTELDLSFSTEKSTFKSVLSLVPAIYMTDFETIKTEGNFALDGMAKGKLVGDQLPAFNLNLKVDQGRFQYPDLPKAGENIAIDLNVKNPGGSDDNTIVNLKNFHIELGGNPIDLKALVTTPVSDANIDAQLLAKMDLASLKDVLPTEAGEQYEGKIDADVLMKGKVSTLEAEDYENFDLKGSIILEGVTYQDSSLDYPVKVNKADFQFSPKSIEMAEFNCLIGKSDIQGKGLISGFLPYYFNDNTITGDVSLTSTLLDLNELAGEDETTETATGEADESSDVTSEDSTVAGVELIPNNIDFVMNTSFATVLYDNITMTNMLGKITVRDEKMSMDNLEMNMLDGQLIMNGFYETKNPKAPSVNFELDINKFDIPKTYNTFNTVEKLAPIAENAYGSFSTDMKLICVLDEKMEPVNESISGGGKFQTKEVQIKDSDVLNQMAALLKQEQLKDPKFTDVDITYEFTDGRVFVKPFDVKMGDYKATIEGSNGFDLTLDYLVATKVPTSALGDASKMAGGLLDQFNQATGANVSMGETIEVKVKIGGTVEKPTIKPVFGNMSGGGDESGKMTDQAKKMAQEELDKLAKQAEDSLRKEAARLQKEAEEMARKEVEKLQKEAEEAAKKEAEKLQKEAEAAAKKEADRLLKEAEDKLKGLFKK